MLFSLRKKVYNKNDNVQESKFKKSSLISGNLIKLSLKLI